jgi:hypothetical protein
MEQPKIESEKLTTKLLNSPKFTAIEAAQKKKAFNIARSGDPDLDKFNNLKQRFLKILNGDKIVSTQLGTPFDIFVSRLSVPDITRTVLLAVIMGSNSSYREYFVPFVTDPNPDNRARNILILLDFAEAVMASDSQVDSYLAYLAKNQTPPLTFSEWQKSLSSAPIGSPQAIIPSARETTLTPDQITQFRNYVTRRFIFEEPGGQIPLADAMRAAGYTDLSKFIDFLIKNTKYHIGKVGEDNLKKELFKLRVESTPAIINLSQYQLRS